MKKSARQNPTSDAKSPERRRAPARALPPTREEPQSQQTYRRPENVRGRTAPLKAREILRRAMEEHTEAEDAASWEAIEEDLRDA